MADIGNLGFLLDSLPRGPVPLPPIPEGAVDPWSGQPLAATSGGDIPPLATPVETTIEVPLAPVGESDRSAADLAGEAPAPAAVTLPELPTQPTGTPISREEVLDLLSALDATIYLMV